MKALSTLLFLLLANTISFSQDFKNDILIQELHQINEKDQKIRGIIFIPSRFDNNYDSLRQIHGNDKDFIIKELTKEMNKNDEENIIRIKEIIHEHGYPGKSLVGNKYSSTAWLVLQHSKDLKDYIEILHQAALTKEMPFTNYALSIDRLLMHDNQPQRYGSQARYVTLKDGTKKMIIWPIENPKEIKKIRKEAGFQYNIKKNAKNMNVPYKIYKIEDISLEYNNEIL